MGNIFITNITNEYFSWHLSFLASCEVSSLDEWGQPTDLGVSQVLDLDKANSIEDLNFNNGICNFQGLSVGDNDVTIITRHLIWQYKQKPPFRFDGCSVEHNQHICQINPSQLFIILLYSWRTIDISACFTFIIPCFDFAC